MKPRAAGIAHEVRIRSSEDPLVEHTNQVGLGSELDGHRYQPGAVVPKGVWTPLAAEQKSRYFVSADSPRAPESEVEIFRLPESISEAIDPDRPRDTLILLSTWITENRPPRGRMACDGLVRDEADRITLTRDLDGFAALGLHVDMWDQAPIERRGDSRLRLDINVGREARYFVFLPQLFRTIVDQVGAETPSGSDDAAIQEIARNYLRTTPASEILRIRLEPGWAYLAPTENLIHDGSSSGSPGSIHVAFRGWFEPTPAA